MAAKDQASVKKTVFFRARHLVTEIEKSKLSLLHLLHTFVATLLKIVAGRGGPISHVSVKRFCFSSVKVSLLIPQAGESDWVYVLESVDVFNKFLVGAGLDDLGDKDDTRLRTLIHGQRNEHPIGYSEDYIIDRGYFSDEPFKLPLSLTSGYSIAYRIHYGHEMKEPRRAHARELHSVAPPHAEADHGQPGAAGDGRRQDALRRHGDCQERRRRARPQAGIGWHCESQVFRKTRNPMIMSLAMYKKWF